MARHDPARLIRGGYCHLVEVPTRYQDLDPLGHVNNVAIASIFETARMRFHAEIIRPLEDPAGPAHRWVVGHVAISYLAEGHADSCVEVHSANGHIGVRSRQTLSAAFQGETCIALCDTTLVCTDREGECIEPEFRSALEKLRFRGGDVPQTGEQQ